MKKQIKFGMMPILALSLLLCGCGATESIADENGYTFVEGEVIFDVPAIENSDSAFLLDPVFVIDEENFQEAMDGFFTAPATLYCTDEEERSVKYKEFYEENDGSCSDELFGTYRIHDPALMAAFSNAFRGKTASAIILEEFPDMGGSGYFFGGYIGEITISFQEGKTYVNLYRRDELFDADEASRLAQQSSFVLEEDMHSEIEQAFERVKQKGEVVSVEEYMGNFE